jgi:Putative Ig domain
MFFEALKSPRARICPNLDSAIRFTLLLAALITTPHLAAPANPVAKRKSPVITSANSTTFAAGVAGTFTVTTTGTPTPSLTETGALPSGVTFKDNGNGTATLSGTPATVTTGRYTLTITAHNGVGSDASQSFTLTVGSAPSIGFVQVNYATPQTPQTKVTVAYLQAQTAGNLNVVVVGWNDATAKINSVTDSKGNAYALAVGPTIQSGTATQAIYYAKNIAAAAANANTVTVTFNIGATSPDVRIAEYSGIDPTNPVDAVATAQGNGASSDSGSVNTGNANDLLVGANLVQQLTTGPGPGYTSRVITSPDGDILEDQIVNTSGSHNATAAITGGAWIMQMVAFRAAAGGVGTSVTVTVSPKRAAVTTSQSQQFTATVTDPQNGGVSWSVDGINSGSSAVGTVSATGLFTPGSQIGLHTVSATSNSNPSVSASASIAVTDLKGVFTYHNDPDRTGQNLQEYALTTTTVNSSNFGVLFSCPVDGYVYAQPLYIANFAIGGQTRNVVFVATEHDSVYAFDADSSSCVKLWQTSFLSSGVTTVPPADTGETGDLIPEIGITSTPVIDPSTSTIYVVAKTKETVGSGCSRGNPCYVHRLHALNMTNGAEKFGGPVVLSAPNFVPLYHLQRPALLLNNGTVYIGFGSHGDFNAWQGWLMAYSSSTLTQQWVWHSTDPTNGNNEGAIWGSGNGPALDANGNIYVETGNGVFDGTSNFSDSVVKLSPAGARLDYFTPFDQDVMQNNDIDLGSSGPIILPDAVGSAAHPHVMIATGKVGVVYLLDQTNMGQYHSGANQDLGEVSVGFNTTNITGGFFGQPAYWNGNIYTIIVGDSLRQFTVGNGSISTVSSSNSNNTFTFRGATPAVSANGATNGIVWVADITAYQSGGAVVLDAYDATNVSNPLYSSPSNGSGAAAPATKFTVPTVANGKVYVGGQLAFTVCGLLPN